jgi:hypothetical protein
MAMAQGRWWTGDSWTISSQYSGLITPPFIKQVLVLTSFFHYFLQKENIQRAEIARTLVDT